MDKIKDILIASLRYIAVASLVVGFGCLYYLIWNDSDLVTNILLTAFFTFVISAVAWISLIE